MSTKRNKNDLSKLSTEEVLSAISESEQRLKKMMFSHAVTPIENPMNIRNLRREIARLKTQHRKLQLGS